MSTKRYQELTSWLFQQFPSYQLIGQKAYKPTLQNTRLLLDKLDNPEKTLKFVHVAGSNGKGSVCSMLASVLKENGLVVGLFTSPHIIDFRERIRVNGECINEQCVIDFIELIHQSDWEVEPSFFEITFAMALFHFRKMNCDICVIETGLGGRLDATNVISPLATAITSISLEHTQILGNTISEIAKEKGGIIKQGVPIVIGNLPAEAESVLIDIAEMNCAKLYQIDNSQSHRYRQTLLGDHQLDNFGVAKRLLDILETHFALDSNLIQIGLDNLYENTGFMGRIQIVSTKPLTIYDVSHNVDGLQTSLKAVRNQNKGKLHIIYGTSNDKDVDQILPCFSKEDALYLCEFSNPRSMKLEQLNESAIRNNCSILGIFQSGPDALKQVRQSCSLNDTILVTGSFFLLSDFFQKKS